MLIAAIVYLVVGCGLAAALYTSVPTGKWWKLPLIALGWPLAVLIIIVGPIIVVAAWIKNGSH